MIKVMWFLKRADHLSLEEFRSWWLNHHCHDIARDQAPYLKRYVVNVRVPIDDLTGAAGGGPGQEPNWDGCAEQWFETREDFDAVYSRLDRPTRADTLKHCSAFDRLVVEERQIALEP